MNPPRLNFASLVEFVEALTVVLAVGSVRGWRSALGGCAAAIGVLLVIVLSVGRALTRVPLHIIQLVVGVLLVMFGLRWLRKAILRSAGLIPLHDERAAFSKNASAMRTLPSGTATWDKVGFATSFNITMLEGTEVVFIVIAIGAGGAGMLLPAGLGAIAALIVVVCLGLILHRPLASGTGEHVEVYGRGASLSFWYVLGGRRNGSEMAGIRLVHPGSHRSVPGGRASHRPIVSSACIFSAGNSLGGAIDVDKKDQ